MAGYFRASAEVLQSRRTLADAVRTELVRAGLPAQVSNSADELGGAVIEVDDGDDEAGGVFVRWEPVVELADLAVDSVAAGQFDHPSIAHSGLVSETMRNAMIAILDSADFDSAVVDDELRPFALQVTPRPA